MYIIIGVSENPKKSSKNKKNKKNGTTILFG